MDFLGIALYIVSILLLSLAIMKYSKFKGWVTLGIYILIVVHWYFNATIPPREYGLRPELVIIQILTVVAVAYQFART
jgi:hypothetical protein